MVDSTRACAAAPQAAARTIYDILNEPDGRELGWSDLNTIYTSVADAIYAVNPNALFAIEGTGQTQLGANVRSHYFLCKQLQTADCSRRQSVYCVGACLGLALCGTHGTFMVRMQSLRSVS